MKSSINLLTTVLLLVTIMGCSEDEPSTTSSYDIRIFKYNKAYDSLFLSGITDEEAGSLEPMSGVIVKFYRDEADFLADQNPYSEHVSDADGFIQFEREKTGPDYYVRAEVGEFNNFRTATQLSSISDLECISECDRYKVFPLTLSPSKLRLKVLNSSGQPVSSASVKLYVSEEDYINDTHIDDWLPLQYEMGYSLYADHEDFFGQTDDNGEITFSALAPKVFWFRVTSTQGNNDNGLNHLPEPLPVNPEVIYTTEVVVE